ncbi:MAG: glutamine amidotransferase-related protein [Desulfovibrio sp.]|uniref:glutamine amidotransferase-related protein n=1 Tax=Desulfovibrio sp. 7SRBS1 TaxID=3378064 RepID=UPI003B417DF6
MRILTVILMVAWAIPVWAGCPLTSVKMTTNPCLDVVVTRTTPTLSFLNAEGGDGARKYQVQLDVADTFSTKALRQYTVLEVAGSKVSALLVPSAKPLADKSRWWWRVRAVDKRGNIGPWAVSRFFVDTRSDDAFVPLTRAVPVSVKVSSGSDAGNLVDYSDQGLATQWRSAPPGDPVPWVELDMGKSVAISRVWMLADFGDNDGWPRNFHWLASDDGKSWSKVQGLGVSKADTYRFLLDSTPTTARFWRLEITEWTGYAPALNEILLYSPGMPAVPGAPDTPYILVVGNQHDGATFTLLSQRIQEEAKGLGHPVHILQVPHWQVSMDMFNRLEHKPVAIVLSGNNADYNNLPMFAYNGEYELIRKAPVPILGICAGNQMLAFQAGYTRVRSMGWSDITAMQKPNEYTKLHTVVNDPLFAGLPQPFTAAEVHGWAISEITPGYELVAESGYIQSIRRKDGMRHGVQFHPEIKEPYNQGQPVLKNFLRQVLTK